MAYRFFPPDMGAPALGSSSAAPLLFNRYQFGGGFSGSGEENCSSRVREAAQEITQVDIDWRYAHEAKVLRELVEVKSIESTPARRFINPNMLYPTHGHGFGYEQWNPFLGYPAYSRPVNSLPRQRQETGDFTGYENEVFSHYASSHNIDLRGIRVLGHTKVCRWSQANVEGNFPTMKLPEADVEHKLTTASRPESEIPGNIPFGHCPKGSHKGKMPCHGSVITGNLEIFHRPRASITSKLPPDNHSATEILIKANIHDQKKKKGRRKENLTNVKHKLTPASRPESEIPGNIPPGRCQEGSHKGKMPCHGGVTTGNLEIFHRPQASITSKLPSDNQSASEILIKGSIHDKKEEKGRRKENLSNVEHKLTAASRPESEITGNIPLGRCPKGSHKGKMPSHGSVTTGNLEIVHRFQASISSKLPSVNHSVSEISIKANIHDQKEEKGCRKENLTNVEHKLTAASRPESEITGNILLERCPEGSHEGKMPCHGSVTTGNLEIFHHPQASITSKLPSDNHSVSEIFTKANIHDQKEEKGCRKENLTNVSAAEVLSSSVNSECHLVHQLDIEKFSPERPVCSNGTALTENTKKRKRNRSRKSMKIKAQFALETQSSVPHEKTVEELSCSSSKVEAHLKGKKLNAEGGSSIATKGIKRVKNATEKLKDGRKKFKNFKRTSKRINHDRKFWCEMCNVKGINETLMFIHRNGRKHLRMLRKNRGAVLVVSNCR